MLQNHQYNFAFHLLCTIRDFLLFVKNCINQKIEIEIIIKNNKMTIESDYSIDLKIKHQALGFNSSSLSKIATSLPSSYKSISSFNNSSKSSTTSSISSPSPTSSISSSSSSSTSYSYSLSSGVGSNNTSLKTEQNVLEDSFSTAKSRPTPLSEFILSGEQQNHDINNSKSNYSNKSSSSNVCLVERHREYTIIDQFPELSIEQQTNLINKWVPFCDIQKKIIVPDADPKKFIFNYNSSNLSAKKELNYLGIIDVNPDEYTQKYGAELKQSTDLPKYILDIKTPDNLKLAAEITEPDIHELEGDVNALKLVDLDREELGIYRQFLQRIGITS